MRKREQRRQPTRLLFATLAGAAALLAACGQPAPGGATNTTDITSATATVGSGGACIPDLGATQISVVAPSRGNATGVIADATSAQQVREGIVPAPPESQVITVGAAPLPLPVDAGGALPSPAITWYSTDCAPSDVRAFYVAALLQNQWTGDFAPASDVRNASAATDVFTGSGNTSATNRTLFDLAALEAGHFINVHPSGDTAAFIEVLAAIEAPGTPQERHPTYVEVITQPSPSTSATRPLPPSTVTTPNVGASAAPPTGGS